MPCTSTFHLFYSHRSALDCLASTNVVWAAVNILLTSTVLSRDKWPVLASILGPLMKLPGGGSHATAFFAVALLRDQLNGSSR